MLVVDASVLAPALADDGPHGDVARSRLRGQQLSAPGLIDLAVVKVVRRRWRAGDIDARRAGLALDDLAAMPIERAHHVSLLARAWELRDNLTPYDAAYVALAEVLEVPLLTADARLARSPGLRCGVEVVSAGS
ncbi:putative nucleic acid-binding protein [Mumia flava]|uniref:Ribonuclease VapC n=1 Tax=Mumia flava TaxID=1348852 RepID=A0A0B2BU36_9ACTN|nr:type II toxin-antitoxin system VapC family toxin [Mumia flava]PJJ57060.1 putative nucleic acid-binding protein [Mumia flava]